MGASEGLFSALRKGADLGLSWAEKDGELRRGGAAAARKQLWHMFLVAGFPGRPQLLAQSVTFSGTLSSVSSSLCAMAGELGTAERRLRFLF